MKPRLLDATTLNRATLERQLLLRREPQTPRQAICKLIGLQAQEPASPYLALWTRLQEFEAIEFDRLLTERAVLKSTLMRITLHNVVAEDYPLFYAAMAPSLRLSRVYDKRFVPAGVSLPDAQALLRETCRFLEQERTEADLVAWLASAANSQWVKGDAKIAWWALKTFGPWTRVPADFSPERPWRYPGEQYTLAASPEAAVAHEVAVQSLLLRFLAAYGPSSAQDFARFTLLRSPVVTAALKASADRLVTYHGAEGQTLYDLTEATLPDPETPAPARLLPLFDNLLLGHVHSSRVLPAEYRPRVSRVNGDLLPTVLVDGWVAGVWRVLEGGLEVTAFHKLSDEQWEGVAHEAKALLKFLRARDRRVFFRHHHWWNKGIEGNPRVFTE